MFAITVVILGGRKVLMRYHTQSSIAGSLSDAFLILALGTLILAAGLIIVVMVQAKIGGYLPEGTWGEWPNVHGPWRYTFFNHDSPIYRLRIRLLSAIMLLVAVVFLSLLSLVLKPAVARGLTFGGSFAGLWLSMHYLYWLID